MGLGYGVQYHFHQYFSYIVEISFIGGGRNRSTRRKLPYDHDATKMVCVIIYIRYISVYITQ